LGIAPTKSIETFAVVRIRWTVSGRRFVFRPWVDWRFSQFGRLRSASGPRSIPRGFSARNGAACRVSAHGWRSLARKAPV